jgi:DNA-binding response OmpR family regulator
MAGTVLVVEEDRERRRAIALPLRADGHDVVELRDESRLLGHLLCSALDANGPPADVVIVAEAEAAIVDVLRMLRCANWDPVIVLVSDAPAGALADELGAATVSGAPLDMPSLRTAVRRPALAARGQSASRVPVAYSPAARR